MMIAKRSPHMHAALGRESGAAASFTLKVLAVVFSVASAALVAGTFHSGQAPSAAPVAAEASQQTNVADHDIVPAAQEGSAIAGADLSASQPFYDESAGQSIPAP
jgi:hypothetical protein